MAVTETYTVKRKGSAGKIVTSAVIALILIIVAFSATATVPAGPDFKRFLTFHHVFLQNLANALFPAGIRLRRFFRMIARNSGIYRRFPGISPRKTVLCSFFLLILPEKNPPDAREHTGG